MNLRGIFQTSAILSLSLLLGCAHLPHVAAPSFQPVLQTVATARTEVAAAQTNSNAARTSLAQAQISASKLLRVAPPELRAEIQRLRLELDSASLQIDALTAHLLTADTQLQLSQKNTLDLQSQVQTQTAALDRANTQLSTLNDLKKRVNSLFGIGALFYGIQRLATAGIIGILILAGFFLLLTMFAPVVIPLILTSARSVLTLFRRKTS